MLSGGFSYAILSGVTGYTPSRVTYDIMLLGNFSLCLILGALIAWRLVRLWAERKSGRSGARLHVRLVTWFSVIAVIPAILVAIFASVTLNLGLDAMFSDQVKSALGNAVTNSVTSIVSNSKVKAAGDVVVDAQDIAPGSESRPSFSDAGNDARP